MAKQDDWARLTVRMPQELYDRLQAEAANGPLSLNAEIVARLQYSLDAPEHEAEAIRRHEEAALQASHQAMKSETVYLTDRMAEMAAQLARIEMLMVQRGVSPKGSK